MSGSQKATETQMLATCAITDYFEQVMKVFFPGTKPPEHALAAHFNARNKVAKKYRTAAQLDTMGFDLKSLADLGKYERKERLYGVAAQKEKASTQG